MLESVPQGYSPGKCAQNRGEFHVLPEVREYQLERRSLAQNRGRAGRLPESRPMTRKAAFVYSDALSTFVLSESHPMKPIRLRHTRDLIDDYGVFDLSEHI